MNLAQDKYKVKVTQPIDVDHELEYTIKVLKVAQDKYCVEFNRNGGDQLEFFRQFNTVRDELDLEDATY